jgi:peptide/nickel transport system permease protein
MEFLSYLARRSISMIATLIGISVLIFLLIRVMPGDPARLALGAQATREMVVDLRQRMHLNESLYKQYYYWAKGLLHGDLGRSFYSYRNVRLDLKEFFPATIELILFAILILVTVGLLFGVLAASYKDTWIDGSIRFVAYAGVSIPYFLWAIFLLLIFGYFLDIMPTGGRLSAGVQLPPSLTGMVTIDALVSGNLRTLLDALKHLILPAISLSTGGIATAARVTRTSMSDNVKKDYIQVAKSFNIPKNVIMYKYLLKPSLIPTVALLGMQLGVLVANAFLVELIFNWPGFSRYGIGTMLNKDLNGITAVVLIVGGIYVVMNFVVDLVVAYLDPRIRLREA